MEQIIGFVMLLFLLASAYVWWRVLERRQAGHEVLPWVDRDPIVWSPPAFYLVVVWVGIQAWMRLRPVIAGDDAAGPVRQDPLRDLPANAILLGVLIVILLIALTEFGRQPLAAFGVHGHRWREQVRTGALGFVASLLPVFLVLLATLPLREQEHPLIRLVQEAPDLQTVAWVAVMVVVFAPLAEELVFRVILQGTLAAWMGSAAAIVLVAAVFSAVHGWPDALPLFPLALLLGYLYHRQHGYLAVVVMHALFNGWMLAMALLRALGGGADP